VGGSIALAWYAIRTKEVIHFSAVSHAGDSIVRGNAIYRDKCHFSWYYPAMTHTKVDSAGRVVIPKELRDRYGLGPGAEIEIVALPDGVALIPKQETERRVVRRGKVVAIDTGAGVAPAEIFDVSPARSESLDRKGGFSE
jgi:AbrB family looped-hinge helix DNA binding protein